MLVAIRSFNPLLRLIMFVVFLGGCGGEPEPGAAPAAPASHSPSHSAAEMSVDDWKSFLDSWSSEGLALLAESSPEFRSDLGNASLERGTLTFPGASNAQISAAESRLGEALPESYRRFLQASNGFIILALDVEDARLWSTDQIKWLAETEQAFIDAWNQYDTPVSDAEYFNYSPAQDPVHLRPEYLRSALQLSDFVDAAVVLLNPEIKTSTAEWEGWDFGNAWPGAYRYETFEKLMIALRERTLANLGEAIEFERGQQE